VHEGRGAGRAETGSSGRWASTAARRARLAPVGWLRLALGAGLVLAGVLSVAAPSAASTTPPSLLYVSTDGSNAGNTTCSVSHPCATVAYAASIAAPKASIHVGPGKFVSPAVSVDLADVDLTVVGQGTATVLSPAPSASEPTPGIFSATSGSLVVDDLEMEAGQGFDPAAAVSGGALSLTDDTVVGPGEVGVFATGGLLSVASSSFEDLGVGVAELEGSGGGGSSPAGRAPAVTTAAVEVDDSTFSGGVVSGVGAPSAALLQLDGTLEMSNDTIADNAGIGLEQGLPVEAAVSASDFAAGASALGAVLASATPGGPVEADVVASSFVGNAEGGIDGEADDSVELGSSILADNAGGDCTALGGGALAEPENLGDDLADDTTCGLTGTGSRQGLGLSALGLGQLAANGGPTETVAPAPSSPAVGAVPAADTTLCPSADERNVPRPEDGTCDAGAVELAATTTSLALSPSSPRPGEAVSFAVKVTSPAAADVTPPMPPPTGTVVVSDAAGPLCRIALDAADSGSGTCRVAALPTARGQLTVRARFTPAELYLSSAGKVSTTVSAPTTTTVPTTTVPTTAVPSTTLPSTTVPSGTAPVSTPAAHQLATTGVDADRGVRLGASAIGLGLLVLLSGIRRQRVGTHFRRR